MKIRKGNKELENIADKVATRIAYGILKSQRWFADTLEGVSSKWKQKHKWFFLCMVGFVFGGSGIAVIVHSFTAPDGNKSIIPKSVMVMRKNIFKEGSGPIITESEFQKVQEYKRIHLKLMKNLPGLFDSLTLIEQLYYSQKK